jgi:hypothetical protein
MPEATRLALCTICAMLRGVTGRDLTAMHQALAANDQRHVQELNDKGLIFNDPVAVREHLARIHPDFTREDFR